MTLESYIPTAPFVYHIDNLIKVDSSSFPKVYQGDSKVINIQNYFNGSLVRFCNRLIFATRCDQIPWYESIRIVICELDSNYQPIPKTAKFLDLTSLHGYNHVEDPRLFIHDGALHVAYNDGSAMYVAVLNAKLEVVSCSQISNFRLARSDSDGREKNWTPFSVNRELYFIYSDHPRIIIQRGVSTQFYMPEQNITWEYGTIRGGTPAVRWGDTFLTFFHSCKAFSIPNSKHTARCYFMGAYTFETKPPFRVRHMTKIPLMRGAYTPYQPNSNLCVVFPAGAVEEKDHFAVSLGINDQYDGIIKISKSLLHTLMI